MRNVRKAVLFTVMTLILMACEKHVQPERTDGSVTVEETVERTVEFEIPEMTAPDVPISASSRAGESVSVELNDNEKTTRSELYPLTKENVLTGLWLLQFDNSTQKLMLKTFFSASQIQNNKVNVTLASSSSCTAYFVGNVFAGTFNQMTVNTSTLKDFEALTLNYTSENAVTNGEANLPMAASWSGNVDNLPAKITLKRLVAKLTFTCKVDLEVASHSFVLKTIRLRSVPNVSSYKVQTIPTGTTPVYPIAYADNFMDYDPIDVSDQTGNAETMRTTGITQVWYLPENLRGVKSSLTDPQKGEVNAPEYSTFVELTGIYTLGSARFKVSYHIYPGTTSNNNFNVVRNYKYAIVSTIRGAREQDLRVVRPEDLGKNGTANCYLVSKAGTRYRFKIIGGNGSSLHWLSNGQSFTHGTIDLSGIRENPFVVWETESLGSVIEPGSLSVIGDYLYFTTAGKRGAAIREGNAVIGVSNNNTLGWSWHIWATSYDPDKSYDTYTTRTLSASGSMVSTVARNYKVMKYNLGADATAKEGEVGLYGLLYQWGRKDPFMGPATLTSSGTDFARTYNAKGHEWRIIENAQAKDNKTWRNISYAFSHPTHFIKEGKAGDWLNATKYVEQVDALWGNGNTSDTYPNASVGTKSPYDPCPPGWKVAPQDLWTNFSSDGTGNGTANVSGSFNYGWHFYCQGSNGDTAFYPAAGMRSRSTGELTDATGTNGWYWSSAPYAGGKQQAGNLHINRVSPLSSSYRANAFSVRCVHE